MIARPDADGDPRPGPQQGHQAPRYRDALLIALLISCPIRLKNLAGLVIGQHLVLDGPDYRLTLTATETKTRRPYVAAVPHELTSYINQWLEVHRVHLNAQSGDDIHRVHSSARAEDQVSSAGNHLWLDRWGNPMSGRSIQRQIWLRTEQASGKGICPHLFRDISVTELVDCAPEEIGIAPDLLGHADLRTTRKHYIQGEGHDRACPHPGDDRRATPRSGSADEERCLTPASPGVRADWSATWMSASSTRSVIRLAVIHVAW